MYDDILLFIQIIEYGNFHKASKHLNIAQSTLTRRIQILEEQLKIQLLQRDCRTFKLTSAGELFYEQFAPLLPEAMLIIEDFKNTCSNELIGTLKIGLPPLNFIRNQLVQLITVLVNNHPQVQIISQVIDSQIDLKRDALNLALSTHLPTSNTHQVTILASSKLKLYASPGYITDHGLPQSLADFSHNHRYVLGTTPQQSQITQLVAKQAATTHESIIPVTTNIYTADSQELLGYANTDHYIILIMDMIAEEYVQAGSLVPILPEFSFGQSEIYLITPNRAYSHLEQELINLLHQNFTN